jgi:hypothetical protein
MHPSLLTLCFADSIYYHEDAQADCAIGRLPSDSVRGSSHHDGHCRLPDDDFLRGILESAPNCLPLAIRQEVPHPTCSPR